MDFTKVFGETYGNRRNLLTIFTKPDPAGNNTKKDYWSHITRPQSLKS
jgi:hypothetical protein